MEELMPELVALVLSHVEPLSLVACRFVSTTWMRASPPPPLGVAPRLASKLQQQDYSAKVAANGWLGLLQWARANGCPWNKRAMCKYAAKGGNLAVLQWVRANGCHHWDEWT
jgi:hypothetical protein